MYSYEKRKAAVELYLKYKSYSATIIELGYPSRGMLHQWLNEFKNNEDLHRIQSRKPKYNESQKKKAVDYYLEHGRCVSKTIRTLGYPSRRYLEDWLKEFVTDYKRACRSSKVLVNLSENEKKQAVIELCAKEETASTIANKFGVERTSLYKWKKVLLGDKEIKPMQKKKVKQNVSALQDEVNELNRQAYELKRQVYQLQLEKDVLEKAAEIIKKDQGITLQALTNREKAIVIDTLRDKYKLMELLSVFHMAKSSYCYQIKAMSASD